MGLDQYAYKRKLHNNDYQEPEEFHYWRKHPAMHDWMEELWERKGRPDSVVDGDRPEGDDETVFNCVHLDLTLDDLRSLKNDIVTDQLNYGRRGFFFGGSLAPTDQGYHHQKATDLRFVAMAMQAIADGYSVQYYSWW